MARPRLPRVLIVDDDPAIRLLAEQTLRAAGFDVTCSADGSDAIERFAEIAPDVALLDVEMSSTDGFTLCRAIRELPEGANIPIIMVTAHDDAGSVNSAYAAGAQDFINKPIPWAVLPHRIRYVLQAKTAFDELRRSELRNRLLLKAIPDQIHIVDADGQLVENLSDSPYPAAAGDSLEAYLPVDGTQGARDCIARALETGDIQTFELGGGSLVPGPTMNVGGDLFSITLSGPLGPVFLAGGFSPPGISVRELARLTDLSASFVSQLERGLARPRITSLHRVARALGTTAQALLSTGSRE